MQALPFILTPVLVIFSICLIANLLLPCRMFNQSGIRTITLYNAATTTFTQVSKTSITDITGDSILITNLSKPTLEQTVKKINRKNYFEYTFAFILFGLASETNQFRNKFGWLVLIEFLDGEYRFLNSPVFFNQTDFDTNKTNVYPIQLKPDRPTAKTLEVI